MVLESTVICCDNSDYQRNGDYPPNRLVVQKDAINMICINKKRSHPENDVGLLTMSNKVEVVLTLTTEIGRLFGKLGLIEANGQINFLTALRIAQMVLKHRPSKNHRMRIITFVGSPLEENIFDHLISFAKRLRKEKVSVDVISFGQHKGNERILREFVDTINGKDGNSSKFIEIERGVLISNVLVNSDILLGEDGSGVVTSDQYNLGFDPDEDPELALALRLSLEDEARRQEVEQREYSDVTNEEEIDTQSTSPTPVNAADFENMTEEQQIAYALQMSLRDPSTEFQATVIDNGALTQFREQQSDGTIQGSVSSAAPSTEIITRSSKDTSKKLIKKPKQNDEDEDL